MTTINMMKPRPLNPTTNIPFRVQTNDGTHTTWFPDGYITKKYKNGNTEVWAPGMYVSKPYMHQTVLPNGALHTLYYTDQEDTSPAEGDVIEWHYIDNSEDSIDICWYNECRCFDDVRAFTSQCEVEEHHIGDCGDCENINPEMTSRCETLGFHVGCGECPVCGPEVDGEDDY